jgi:hypothetical protein
MADDDVDDPDFCRQGLSKEEEEEDRSNWTARVRRWWTAKLIMFPIGPNIGY